MLTLVKWSGLSMVTAFIFNLCTEVAARRSGLGGYESEIIGYGICV